MKSCPDTDRLVDLLDEGTDNTNDTDDADAQAHVDQCEKCRRELQLIRAIPAAFHEKLPVSEALIQRTLAAIHELPVGAPASGAGELALTGALGVLTALAVVVGTGLPAGASLMELIAYSVVIGTGVMIYERGTGRREVRADA